MVSWIFLLKFLPKNFHNQQAKAFLVNLQEKSCRKLIRLFGICPLWGGV